VTSGDLLVLVPWVIFGVALAVICYLLLTRRYGPGRGRRARRRRPPQPPPEGQLGGLRHRREIRKKDQAIPGRHDGAAMRENAVGPPCVQPLPDPPARYAVSMPVPCQNPA
jgi:hypothetical protein